jgi:hypothetical protein
MERLRRMAGSNWNGTSSNAVPANVACIISQGLANRLARTSGPGLPPSGVTANA